ncbi:hypothetical protein AM587_10014737 [Phytophthora nicotianae]|uniref:Uncharacterized protein n=1 Tax=Phytophthora nicotianae TaxID=4792 RepID=A0A0W8DW22_PHYNI|nr:hypothetical protein AM587_10014737 [Phytophthora nicotianae]
MSLSAFVAGVALGGLRYGAVKFQLMERESVVLYSASQVKESFHGDHVCPASIVCANSEYLLAISLQLKTRHEERYEPLPSREHEYYTYVREGWNSKVLAFRNKTYEFFQAN